MKTETHKLQTTNHKPQTTNSFASLCLCSIAILFVFSCKHVSDKDVKPFCNGSQKVTAIYKQYVYDLSGYEEMGGNSPFNLFDENNEADPKNGIISNPFTSLHPKRNTDIYFPLNKGSRVVVDLRVPYKISDIYLYDRSQFEDTVWIYTGDMTNWKLKAKIVTKEGPIGWGWRKLTLDDSTQYVMIRFNSYLANITEAVLYGCPFAPVPPKPSDHYTGERFPKKALKDFLGVNIFNVTDTAWLRPFKYVRMYAYTPYFDIDTINEEPNNSLDLSQHGYVLQNQFHHYADYVAAMKKEFWYSMMGVPLWMHKLGYTDKDRPVTKAGMDPEDPFSYKRHSKMMWTLAAVFGKTPVDTNQMQIHNMAKASGKGTMTIYENGNESDATWVGSKYASPLEYFAQSSADYDGHNGKFGPGYGIYNADSNSKLMMSGTITLDTNRIRILDFLCKTLRPDKKFLWQGGIQYHHYSNSRTNLPRWLQKPAKGITPEEDSLRKRLAAVRDFTYRIQPRVECFLGEYGFDKGQQSWQSTPVLPGYSSSQSQGVMLLRAINAVAFSGMDGLVLYWLKDMEEENSPVVYTTSGLVRQVGNEIKPYPSWFYISTLMAHLGDYIPESIISEKGDVWIYRYRHNVNKDSLAYFIYSPTRTGKKISGYSLHLPAGYSHVKEISFMDNSATGKARDLSIEKDMIRVDVSEVPKLIITGRN